MDKARVQCNIRLRIAGFGESAQPGRSARIAGFCTIALWGKFELLNALSATNQL
jgi:hypothetical protein